MDTRKKGFFSAEGVLDRSEVRFGANGDEYGYARLRIVDRKTGRSSERTLLAFGKVYEAMREAWYDGSKGRFRLAGRQGSLVATAFEPA